MTDALKQAQRLFRQHGGVLRTSQALAAGVHPRTLYALRKAGEIEALDRGLYRLTSLPPLGNPDLVVAASRVRHGIIALISALSFHEITTQIPHRVDIALPKGAEEPRLTHPPLQVVRFSGEAYSAGVETHTLDGIPARIYNPEKTLADCFKFRNRVGLDVCLEAIRMYRQKKPVRGDDLLKYARICRVEKIMRPYLEALL